MIVRKLWVSTQRRRSADRPNRRTTWQVEKEGWFLFGFIPLYIAETRAQEL